MTMLNKVKTKNKQETKKKTKLRTATRAQTSYTRSASCFLTALQLYKIYIYTHTQKDIQLNQQIYV